MRRSSPIHSVRWMLTLSACAALAVGTLYGCSGNKKKKGPRVEVPPIYRTLAAKKVPAFLKDTILEKCDLTNIEPFLVSGYGLVSNLNNTGDSQAPNAVRDYMVKEMVKHKWGSSLSGIKTPSPEEALRDPRNAIVQVDGYLPPGVRKGQRFDVQVSALPDSGTTSLAQGDLFQTDLRIMGANPLDPGGAVNVFARAEGNVFVNPSYAMSTKVEDPAAKRSLRMGVVMNGAASLEDRPIGLRLRQPSMRMSRYIEDRIDQRLQEIRPDTIAEAQDEGIVHLYVPVNLNGDWTHFAGLVTHLYLNNSPEFAAAKAQQLADEAIKPNAPLMDISYCWEALGKASLAVIRDRDLLTHSNPDVAYAAARAAAYLGDAGALQALVNIARTTSHPFQVNAVQVLGTMPNSPAINDMLRPLLNSNETLVRLESYRMLAHNADNAVFSLPIKGGFTLDVIRSDGPPVIYGTRRGEPRLAIIGNRTGLDMPITFMALDGRLTISSDPSNTTVTIFYRPPQPVGGPRNRQQLEQTQPIRVVSRPDIAEIVARLGGEGFDEATAGQRLDFNYAEILSILSNMTAARQLVSVASGTKMPASLILQELPQVQDSIYSAPVIPDQGRPQTDERQKVGRAE